MAGVRVAQGVLQPLGRNLRSPRVGIWVQPCTPGRVPADPRGRDPAAGACACAHGVRPAQAWGTPRGPELRVVGELLSFFPVDDSHIVWVYNEVRNR